MKAINESEATTGFYHLLFDAMTRYDTIYLKESKERVVNKLNEPQQGMTAMVKPPINTCVGGDGFGGDGCG